MATETISPADTLTDQPGTAEDAAAAAALAGIADRWLEHGLCTAPADRPAAEAAVREAYVAAGLPAPRHVVWLPSPFAGALAAALLTAPRPEAGPTGSSAGTPDPDDDTPAPDRDTVPATRTATTIDQVLAALRAQGCVPGEVAPGRAIRGTLRTAPWAAARTAATERLGPAGWAAHWAAGGQRTWNLLVDRVVTPLRTRLAEDLVADVRDPLTERARSALFDAVYGLHEAAWLSAFDGDPRLRGLANVATSAGWWWPYEQVAVLTERPVVTERDNVGRLHRGDGPALAYPDGYGLHVWRGMAIPPEVAQELPRLTVQRIRAEQNAEVRRVMLEHFGYDRYLRESNAHAMHRDECGVLWRINLSDDEPLVMVEVVNSTAEPDGTHRTYWLRVPPDTRTARGGVAWTFGLTEEEYAPLAQT
ncbi:DUF6745 domain-containing protein [Polymorphospora sp. NPDC051019]|uniref:DUF6745 domain-containing protein n=1 Tax=Polymorphospora sp. NPDC051019 TaxID=3155725 RepID=UPI003449DD1E